ncbi:MAG: GlsB/YeaQ/YmgE family stress response membrane protein [Acidimicrobiia bacterium]
MIGFVVFGLVVGVLARLVIPGRQHIGFGTTLLLGLIGSVVGGVVANALGTGDILELNVVGAVVAIVTAVALITIGDRVGILTGRSRRDRD